MFYIIYKITNLVNGKIYIGKHQTKDLNDGYMGSGKYIKRAIKKNGLENFEKEILFQFDNEADMNAKEAELVTAAFVKENTNYNISPGGNGGFGHINNNPELVAKRDTYENKLAGRIAANKVLIEKYGTIHITSKKLKTDSDFREDFCKKVSSGLKKRFENNPGTFTGRMHTEETKNKMRKPKNQGSKNPNFGKMWITDGKNNKIIKKDIDSIPEGWYTGRTIK